jgi:hypothetical protein
MRDRRPRAADDKAFLIPPASARSSWTSWRYFSSVVGRRDIRIERHWRVRSPLIGMSAMVPRCVFARRAMVLHSRLSLTRLLEPLVFCSRHRTSLPDGSSFPWSKPALRPVFSSFILSGFSEHVGDNSFVRLAQNVHHRRWLVKLAKNSRCKFDTGKE